MTIVTIWSRVYGKLNHPLGYPLCIEIKPSRDMLGFLQQQKYLMYQILSITASKIKTKQMIMANKATCGKPQGGKMW